MQHRVMVTGAGGFVGRELCRELSSLGMTVVAAVRSLSSPESSFVSDQGHTAVQMVPVGGVGADTDWSATLAGVDTVIHLAARVHVMRETAGNPLTAFRDVNVSGTERLARAAAAHGVKRFIFLSSIKVNGEQTADAPFREQDVPNPLDPYAVSKWEAEQVLRKISTETGMEVVILRPPLIYGPNVKANFLRLLRWVAQGVPLPLASVQNRRSMIYLGNLVDAIVTCIDHPAVVGNTYMLSDGEDVSTPELIRQMANAFGKAAPLWPLPEIGLRLLGALSGKKIEVDRLLGSLQVGSGRFRHDTGWVPPYTLAQGIRQTVDWYRGNIWSVTVAAFLDCVDVFVTIEFSIFNLHDFYDGESHLIYPCNSWREYP